MKHLNYPPRFCQYSESGQKNLSCRSDERALYKSSSRQLSQLRKFINCVLCLEEHLRSQNTVRIVSTAGFHHTLQIFQPRALNTSNYLNQLNEHLQLSTLRTRGKNDPSKIKRQIRREHTLCVEVMSKRASQTLITPSQSTSESYLY